MENICPIAINYVLGLNKKIDVLAEIGVFTDIWILYDRFFPLPLSCFFSFSSKAKLIVF